MNKREKALELRNRCLEIINAAKSEVRELTDEEQKEFDDTKNELLALSEEIKATEDALKAVEESIPDIEEKSEGEEEENKPNEGEDKPENGETPDENTENKPEDGENKPENGETPTENGEENTEEKSNDDENGEENKPEDGENKPENGETTPNEGEEKTEINTEEEENGEDKPENSDENENKEKKSNLRSMNKDFSIVKAIRSRMNGGKADAFTEAVLNAGSEEFRSNGLQTNGTIQIPGEKRAITVTTEHDDVIETEFQSIIEPLYAKTALAESGAQYVGGLKGDVHFPVMDGKNNCYWESEMTDAKESTATFDNIKAVPHRITCFVDLSKQMLAQDSIGVENAVRKDIINALNDKLEATFLGKGAGVAGKEPKGLLNGLTPVYVKDFAALCDFEAGLEEANIYDTARYILSPKAKAALRAMPQSTKSTRLVLENGEVDGTPAISTTHIAPKEFVFGSFSDIKVCQWSGLDIVVDEFTQARKACVRLVINAYFDVVNTRPESLILGTVEAPATDGGKA